jgi:hypothetical protein
MKRKVELRGTWEREDTSPRDLTGIRYSLRRITAEYYDQGDLWTALDMRAEHQSIGDAETGTRRGTFVARLRVSSVTGAYLNRRSAVSRAKVLLKWIVQDITCRPPSLTVTWSQVTS